MQARHILGRAYQWQILCRRLVQQILRLRFAQIVMVGKMGESGNLIADGLQAGAELFRMGNGAPAPTLYPRRWRVLAG